jgi:4-hydroxy-tetrahydrodipicolinate reductase
MKNRTKRIKVVVTGATGRMGQMLVQQILADKKLSLFGATERPNHKKIGFDIGDIIKSKKTGVIITDDFIPLFAKTDAVIDFSLPKATVVHSKYAAQARIIHVIGTTGFSDSEIKKISYAAQHATIIKSGNMSIGVNILEKLVSEVSKSLSEEFQIQINEVHHKHKIDAPSGTALMLGQAIASSKNKKLEKIKQKSKINTQGKIKKDKIVFSSFRKGNVVGNHDVVFSSNDETIKLSHTALNRNIFVSGALQAVKWGKDKEPGLYSMADVLSL